MNIPLHKRSEIRHMEIIHDAHTTYLKQMGQITDRSTLISVGLLIETHARIFERVRGTTLDDRDQSLCASALRNVLDALGMRDDVLDEYARQVEHARRAAGQEELPLSGAIETVPSAGLAAWHSRISDAAVLAEREGASLHTAASSAPSDPPPELGSLHSAYAQLAEDRSSASRA
jgi:hypothetical protein